MGKITFLDDVQPRLMRASQVTGTGIRKGVRFTKLEYNNRIFGFFGPVETCDSFYDISQVKVLASGEKISLPKEWTHLDEQRVEVCHGSERSYYTIPKGLYKTKSYGSPHVAGLLAYRAE